MRTLPLLTLLAFAAVGGCKTYDYDAADRDRPAGAAAVDARENARRNEDRQHPDCRSDRYSDSERDMYCGGDR